MELDTRSVASPHRLARSATKRGRVKRYRFLAILELLFGSDINGININISWLKYRFYRAYHFSLYDK
ncbi:unnamed protein product [Onchocerca ochengi]|uniref:Uncharacterized protein n=1 Tax=Onchocerca ochengi TaxID=42157 RepID=A0A182ERQ1_ONCOC|nr:unnamed protein product [Onchocerca ochengi]